MAARGSNRTNGVRNNRDVGSPASVDAARRLKTDLHLDVILTALLHVSKTDGMPPTRPRLLTLSAKESLILELLIDRDELYGLQLVAASKRRLKRGTVYVTLGRMEDKGYITSRLENAPADVGGMPRRLYHATPLGRRVLAAWTGAATYLMPEFAR